MISFKLETLTFLVQVSYHFTHKNEPLSLRERASKAFKSDKNPTDDTQVVHFGWDLICGKRDKDFASIG